MPCLLQPTRDHSYFSHYRSYQWFGLNLSATVNPLIILRQKIFYWKPVTFPCSDNSICAYISLGLLL